jgi:hypothetical protein
MFLNLSPGSRQEVYIIDEIQQLFFFQNPEFSIMNTTTYIDDSTPISPAFLYRSDGNFRKRMETILVKCANLCKDFPGVNAIVGIEADLVFDIFRSSKKFDDIHLVRKWIFWSYRSLTKLKSPVANSTTLADYTPMSEAAHMTNSDSTGRHRKRRKTNQRRRHRPHRHHKTINLNSVIQHESAGLNRPPTPWTNGNAFQQFSFSPPVSSFSPPRHIPSILSYSSTRASTDSDYLEGMDIPLIDDGLCPVESIDDGLCTIEMDPDLEIFRQFTNT